MKDDIICALSGIMPTDEEETNEMGGLPEGWIEITVKRVFPNQKYLIVQQLKQQAVQMMLAQIPEDQREIALESVQTQVDVTYHSYESSIKEHETETDTIYISPPENDNAILVEYKKLVDLLGFDDLLFEDEVESDETIEKETQDEAIEVEDPPVAAEVVQK